MSRKIIGVTVGTPMKPQSVIEKTEEERKAAIEDALAKAKESGEFDGKNGVDGSRGTGILKVTTAPSSYTTAIGDYTPKYRIALSTVKTQSGVSDVLIGDIVQHSYYQYQVDYLTETDAYISETRISLRGGAGAAGTTPHIGDNGNWFLGETDTGVKAEGSDANVTSESIKTALGYTPADREDVTGLSEEIVDLKELLYSDITGVVDDNNNIVISGVLANGTYTLKYENEDGTTTTIGTLAVGGSVTEPEEPDTPDEPEIPDPNLFDPAKATLNMRWSNSGGGFNATANGYVVSDYIPVKLSSDASDPTLLRFRGGTFTNNANVIFFDSTQKTLQASDATSTGTGVGPSYATISTDENGDSCMKLGWKNGSFHTAFANAAYFRIGLQVNTSGTALTSADIQDIIITVDEAITD